MSDDDLAAMKARQAKQDLLAREKRVVDTAKWAAQRRGRVCCGDPWALDNKPCFHCPQRATA